MIDRPKIDREAIEAKARQLEEAIDETQQAVRSGAMMAAIGVGAVVALSYVLGQRKGKSSSAHIEIHRLK